MSPEEKSHSHAGELSLTHTGPVVVGGPGYEVRDTNVTAIVVFVVGLFLFLFVAQVGLWGLIKGISGPPAPESRRESPYAETPRAGDTDLPVRGKITPEVVLEITEQRRELRDREEAILGGYGRVADENDKEKRGRVRIPIDRAIDLIAERGLPATGSAGRTEVEVNSHSGVPADKDKVEKDKGAKK